MPDTHTHTRSKQVSIFFVNIFHLCHLRMIIIKQCQKWLFLRKNIYETQTWHKIYILHLFFFSFSARYLTLLHLHACCWEIYTPELHQMRYMCYIFKFTLLLFFLLDSHSTERNYLGMKMREKIYFQNSISTIFLKFPSFLCTKKDFFFLELSFLLRCFFMNVYFWCSVWWINYNMLFLHVLCVFFALLMPLISTSLPRLICYLNFCRDFYVNFESKMNILSGRWENLWLHGA